MDKFIQVMFELVIILLGAVILNLLWKKIVKPFLAWMLTPVRRTKFYQRVRPAA